MLYSRPASAAPLPAVDAAGGRAPRSQVGEVFDPAADVDGVAIELASAAVAARAQRLEAAPELREHRAALAQHALGEGGACVPERSKPHATMVRPVRGPPAVPLGEASTTAHTDLDVPLGPLRRRCLVRPH